MSIEINPADEVPVSGTAMELDQAEIDAERLIAALDALASRAQSYAVDAAKHRARVAFAAERLRDLRRAAREDGGVYAAARAEVALSILEGNLALAAGFVHRTVRGLRRAPGRREAHAAADEAVSMAEEETRRAA